MKDFRKNRAEVSIDPQLIRQGEQQLLSEISLIETWLKANSVASGEDSPNTKLVSTYQDMLRSRQDMLAILRKQAKQ